MKNIKIKSLISSAISYRTRIASIICENLKSFAKLKNKNMHYYYFIIIVLAIYFLFCCSKSISSWTTRNKHNLTCLQHHLCQMLLNVLLFFNIERNFNSASSCQNWFIYMQETILKYTPLFYLWEVCACVSLQAFDTF